MYLIKAFFIEGSEQCLVLLDLFETRTYLRIKLETLELDESSSKVLNSAHLYTYLSFGSRMIETSVLKKGKNKSVSRPGQPVTTLRLEIEWAATRKPETRKLERLDPKRLGLEVEKSRRALGKHDDELGRILVGMWRVCPRFRGLWRVRVNLLNANNVWASDIFELLFHDGDSSKIWFEFQLQKNWKETTV